MMMMMMMIIIIIINIKKDAYSSSFLLRYLLASLCSTASVPVKDK